MSYYVISQDPNVLAAIIRKVDGDHSLGASELAEAILLALKPVETDGLVERARNRRRWEHLRVDWDELQEYADALDLAEAEKADLVAAGEFLVEQIEKSELVDLFDHDFTNNKAFIEFKELLEKQ